jgi:hypothetical protein
MKLIYRLQIVLIFIQVNYERRAKYAIITLTVLVDQAIEIG